MCMHKYTFYLKYLEISLYPLFFLYFNTMRALVRCHILIVYNLSIRKGEENIEMFESGSTRPARSTYGDCVSEQTKQSKNILKYISLHCLF